MTSVVKLALCNFEEVQNHLSRYTLLVWWFGVKQTMPAKACGADDIGGGIPKHLCILRTRMFLVVNR